MLKNNLLTKTRKIINRIGELSLIYEVDIDIIAILIDRTIQLYFLENIKYFIKGELFYSKFPKLTRSNSILENQNKQIKE